MRFRTHIVNVPLLSKLARALQPLAKQCVIKLTPTSIHFIVAANEGGKEGVQVWAVVNVPTLFSHYRIESNANNEIFLEVNLEHLIKVVKSAENAGGGVGPSVYSENGHGGVYEGEVTMRLNKRGPQALLAFDIQGVSRNQRPLHIAHEININILSPARQKELKEPMCPEPDTHVVLPDLTELRSLVARLGHLSDEVTVGVSKEGTMTLSFASDSVNLSTTWRKLSIPVIGGKDDSDEGQVADEYPPDFMFETPVPVRGLLKFLNSHVVSGTAIACICQNHCLIMYLYIGSVQDAGGVLTFFIPAKAS